jgi:hypothetical protein
MGISTTAALILFWPVLLLVSAVLVQMLRLTQGLPLWDRAILRETALMAVPLTAIALFIALQDNFFGFIGILLFFGISAFMSISIVFVVAMWKIDRKEPMKRLTIITMISAMTYFQLNLNTTYIFIIMIPLTIAFTVKVWEKFSGNETNFLPIF